MAEPGLLEAILALIAAEVIVLGLGLGYYVVRTHRTVERLEGISAAIDPRVRRLHQQPR
jgi:hypothetical protein